MLIASIAVITLGGLAACVNSIFYTARVEQAVPPTGEMISVNGCDMHVLRAGTAGPVVLMIHGASANAREFDWTLAPRLSANHRVLMVDRPGHGYSERPDNSEDLGVQAAQVAGVLDALAPGERAVVVGHSFGGAVALRLALDYPDRVDGLVLLAPVSHDWGSDNPAWYNRYATTPLIGPAFATLVPVVGPTQVRAGIDDVFSPQAAPDGYFEKAGISLLFRPSEFRANAHDVIALRAELAAQQVRYEEITAPVVVFSGAQDTVLKPQLHVGRLKHQVAGLELVALAEEGHMPHHAQGDQVAAAIARLAAD